jgi:hypothetical protein
VSQSIFIKGKIELMRYAENGQLQASSPGPLNEFEQEFFRSERILCKADFEYYLSRHHLTGETEAASARGTRPCRGLIWGSSKR